MKLTLKQKQFVLATVGIIGLIVLLIGEVGDVIWLDMLGLLGIAAMVVLNLVWLRCPHCGEWLGKQPGDYCKNCGKKLDWE